MNINLGDRVMTADERDAGVVKHLLMNAETPTVDALVLEKGLFLHTDIEISGRMVADTKDGLVQLACTSEELSTMPVFERSKYVPEPPDAWDSALFPPSGALWPALSGPPGVPAAASGFPAGASLSVGGALRTHSQAPVSEEAAQREQEEAVIERGSEVYAADGTKIGEIDSIAFDPETGKVRTLLVRSGLLFSSDTELPGEAVASLDDGRVTLRTDGDTIERWSRNHTTLLF